MLFVGIILFALLIIAHEFGHFIVARRNHVEVEEFGIGFPPRLFGKKFGETLYSINLVPLGGFVKLKGESDSDRRPGSFGASSLWSKVKILLAGVGMNLVAAAFIMLLLAFTQLPTIIEGQFQVPANQTLTSEAVVAAQIVEDSPASAAGIISGDEILSINEETVHSAEQLRNITQSEAGNEVSVSFSRKQEVVTATVTLDDGEEGGYLGVVPIDLETSRYTWAAPIVAVGLTLQMVWLVLATLGEIISGLLTGGGREAAAGVAGPVGVVFLLQNLGEFGISYLMFLVASISVSLAVFNALPIPALDGGRLAVISLAHAFGKSLSEKLESAIHATGFIALIGLLILITYVDIQRFF